MKLLNIAWAAVVASAIAASAPPLPADSGKEELRKSLKDIDLAGAWIYDDVEQGFAEAKKTGKPLLIVFR